MTESPEDKTPTDFDVDECVLMYLGTMKGVPQTFDSIKFAVGSMTDGFLAWNHLTHRMLELRASRKIRLVKNFKVNGKGKGLSAYCLPEHYAALVDTVTIKRSNSHV